MPGKIANTLSDSALVALLDELRALSGEPTLKQIQTVAARHGVSVSLEGAKTFRKTTFKDHLDRLRNGREKSEQILAAVRQGGAHPLDAVEEAAAADLLDAYTSGADVDVASVVKIALQLRASLEQRKDRDRNDADLARRQADSEAHRAADRRRIEMLEQRLQIQQLDAAAAVIEHARQIKLVVADKSLTGPARTERIRKILFGDKPADFVPVTSTPAA